jgi:hypothetical protein
MSWVNPKTWAPGEMVTAPLANQHIRDNFSVLSAQVDTTNGYPQPCLKSYAYSSGQGNAAGGSDTELTSYAFTIPAGGLAGPGDMLLFEGLFTNSSTAGAWTGKISFDGGSTKITLVTSSTVSTSARFRLWLTRRTQTTGSAFGLTEIGTSLVTYYLINAAVGTVNFSTAISPKFYCSHGTLNNTKLTEVRANYFIGVQPGAFS